MATPESARVDAHRRTHFDQVAILTEKGGRGLFRTLANRAGTNVSEMARTAILHHAGLNIMPYPEDLARSGNLDDHRAIDRALRHLQNKERSLPPEVFDELSPDPYSQVYESEMDALDARTLCRLCEDLAGEIRTRQAEAAQDPLTATTQVHFTGRQLAALRRILANAEPTQETVIIK